MVSPRVSFSMQTHIYRLHPLAAPDDPGWSLHAWRGEVLVRAQTAGDARLVAAEAEAGSRTPREENDDVHSIRTSAFIDDKLYGVTLVESSRHSSDGPRGVLEGLA